MAFRCNTCRSDIPPGNATCPRCGAPVTGGPPAKAIERLEDVAPGAILADRYEMIRELGAGGMGVVWLAHDRVRDEPVALKLLPRAVSHDPVAMVGIRREANLSLKLTHPNILRLLNLELAPFPFLLMEFVEGRSLQLVLAEKMEGTEDGGGRLLPREITPWLPGLADGLDHAHKIGVIHRDIKPANIMLIGALENPVVKLTDFGIAAQLRDTATHLTQQGMAGTPVYMAPEQLKRKRIDKRVDIYALGVTLYQLLSGTLPFLSEYQIHNDPVPEIEGQTQLMHEVLCKALAREPNDRYQSAGELAADFALVVEHGDSPIPASEQAIEIRAPAPVATPAHAMPAQGVPVERPVAVAGAAAAVAGAPMAGAVPAMPPPITQPGNPSADSRAMAQQGLAAMAGESNIARRLRAMGGSTASTQTMGPPPGMPAPPPPEAAPPPPPPPPPPPSRKVLRAVIPPGFVPAGANNKGLEQYRCEKDGGLMVLIPVGTFTQGSTDGGDDERPDHQVRLRAYLVDVVPVSNKMFEKFVTETSYQTEAERDGKGWAFDGKRFTTAVKGADWKHPSGPDDSIAGKGDAPVVQVSWNDAEAYAAWAGKKLPTEAQWERAARGGTSSNYPWGDGAADGKACFNTPTAKAPIKSGSFPANDFGLHDMAGNVWEWCADWYSPTYYKEASLEEPAGPISGGSKVVRGGNWHANPTQLRCAYRHRSDPVQRYSGTGFRCVVPVETVEE